jgi:proline iminopeptidase
MSSPPVLRIPYPPLAPYRSHALAVSHGHVLHIEERGRADGIAALVLHGGPGSGMSPLLSRFFDPSRYRVIAVDQRGAGRSTPRGSIEHNTTEELIADLERLRESLGVPRWLVVGGSWGATLALAYAAAHPTAVAGLLLRAVFLARAEDIERFFQRPQDDDAPAWARFAGAAPVDRRHDLLGWLSETLAAGGAAAERAALAWWQWECALAGAASTAPAPRSDAIAALVDRYRVQSHYLLHRCWLDAPPLLARAALLPAVPTLLLHGSGDRICPPQAALDLLRRIPHGLLRRVEGAGHDPAQPAMAAAMVEALDAYAADGRFEGMPAARVPA